MFLPSRIDINRVQVRNYQLANLFIFINETVWEKACSDSASSTKFTQHDYLRYKEYLDLAKKDLRKISGKNEDGTPYTITVKGINGQQSQKVEFSSLVIDVPDVSGRLIDFINDPPYVVPPIQNHRVQEIIEQTVTLRNQILVCQSARDLSGINKADHRRIIDYLKRIEATIELTFTEPEIDRPRTNPGKSITPPGDLYGSRGLRDFGSLEPSLIKKEFTHYYSFGNLVEKESPESLEWKQMQGNISEQNSQQQGQG